MRAQDVSRRCGWRVHFGPVHARDLPRYLAGGREKTEDMRRVRFGMRERLEMAAAWGVPGALIFGGVAAVIRPAFALPLAALALLLALAVFTGYDRMPGRRRWILNGAAALAAFLVALGAGAGVAGLATAALAALAFEDPGGSRIEPDVIRRFKLNLMGQRSVDAS